MDLPLLNFKRNAQKSPRLLALLVMQKIKTPVANAVLKSTRKSTKYAINVFEGEESSEHTLEI